MNLDQIDNIFAPRDIRRYPSELERVPSRGATKNKVEYRSLTFSEIGIDMNGVNRFNPTRNEPPVEKNSKPFMLWEKDGFGFADIIDVINPLQHIPIVATIYRNLSGDQIGAVPRVIGGALWGRIGGFVAGLANAVVEWWSGKDIGDHIYAALFSPASKLPDVAAVAQMKARPASIVAGAVAMPEAPKPQPPAAALESDAVDPNALRSQRLPLPRAAFDLYEKNRHWGGADDSLRIRFPA
jgi:hypothetical protein